MSKQKTTTSSISRDVYIKYRKLANTAKIRSGILERYTYKTDTGKLLTSASLDKSCSQGSTSGQPYPNIPAVRDKLNESKTTNSLETKFLKTLNRKTLDSQPSVSIYKVGNSSKDNKVRTEHCDSTTDIVEYLDKSEIDVVHALVSDTCKSPSSNTFINGTETPSKSSQTIHIESDSDCEIIDVRKYEENTGQTSAQTSETVPNQSINEESVLPKTKILNWISKPDPVIFVISDSDDEETGRKIENSKHNAFLNKEFFTFLCEKTGLQKLLPRIKEDDAATNFGVCRPVKIAHPEAIDFHKVRTRPRTSSMSYPKMTVAPTLDKCADDKESVEMINEKYFVVKNKLSPFKSGNLPKPLPTPSRAQTKSPEFWLHSPKRELSPPCKDTTQQKAPEPLSPETMKSEFYKYLKINTNPLAEKTATVTQNRRSNRVKNLIMQIEKAKELDTIRNEYEKPIINRSTDIRKKYMKYTKPKLVFPSPPLEYNQIIDFDQSFTIYARQERLNYGELVVRRTTKLTRPGIRQKQGERSGEKGHLLRRRQQTIVTKKKKLVIRVQKKQMDRNLLTGKKQDHSSKTTGRMRRDCKKNLRNTSRMTRCNTDTFKSMNAQKFKARRNKLQVILKKNSSDTFKNNDEQNVLPDVNNILTEIPKITDNQLERKTEDKINLPIMLKKEPVTPLKSNTDSNSTLPNILAKKLSEALHKHKQDENLVSERTLKTGVNAIEKFAMKIPACKVDCVSEQNTKKLVPHKKGNIVWQILECAQSSIECPSASVNSTNLNSELEDPSEKTEISAAEVKKVIESENINGDNCQSGSSTGNLFLGFTSEDQKLYSPLMIRNYENYNCLGFSYDEHTARINSLMQEIITRLSTSQFMVEPVNKTETENIKTLPNIIVTESSDNETSGQTSGLIYSSESSNGQEEAHTSIVVIDPKTIQSGRPDYIPLNRNMKIKSLHTSLMYANSKCKSNAAKSAIFELSDSDSSIASPKTPKGILTRKSTTHEIDINRNDGAVFNAYYVDDILIIVQVKRITFWKQTALGNILGVQNMWLPRGNLERIILDPGCVNRRSSEMTMSVDNAVAYMELWTKEHKCCYRECPIADVFATIYFQKGNSAPDKKVIQLENIKGYVTKL